MARPSKPSPKSKMKNKAIQGPNGWYVGEVGSDGFHRQPEDGGTLTETQARRAAKRENHIPSYSLEEVEADPELAERWSRGEINIC